jgi:hypothetical protein
MRWKNDIVKRVRSRVIADYLGVSRHRGVVIFSCGNAAEALVNVLPNDYPRVVVAPNGPLSANRWWPPYEIQQAWPDWFDATPGHLPMWMYVQILERMQKMPEIGARVIKTPKQVDYGPTLVGSGETIILFRWLFPALRFEAVQIENDPATADVEKSPLFPLIGPIRTISRRMD